MATSEGEFKSEFKKDLRAEYPSAVMWTNTDLIRSGLPDISILPGRKGYFAIEAKFIKSLPKRSGSKALKHDVSVPQQNFLNDVIKTGNTAIVLIGMTDVACVMREIKQNYTLDELMKAPRIEKIKGHWQVKGFLDEQK